MKAGTWLAAQRSVSTLVPQQPTSTAQHPTSGNEKTQTEYNCNDKRNLGTFINACGVILLHSECFGTDTPLHIKTLDEVFCSADCSQ
jgi:hypothetical protein